MLASVCVCVCVRHCMSLCLVSGLAGGGGRSWVGRCDPLTSRDCAAADRGAGRLFLRCGEHRRLQQFQTLPSHQEADGARLLPLLQGTAAPTPPPCPRTRTRRPDALVPLGQVNLKRACPFWPDDGHCAIKDCHVESCPEVRGQRPPRPPPPRWGRLPFHAQTLCFSSSAAVSRVRFLQALSLGITTR